MLARRISGGPGPIHIHAGCCGGWGRKTPGYSIGRSSFLQCVTLNPSIKLVKVTELFEYSIYLFHLQASLYQPGPV